MSGVKDVRRVDETHLHWRADVGGAEKEWDTEIIEQVPDRAVSWRSMDAPTRSSARVQLEALGSTRTRVRVAIAYERARTLGVGPVGKASETVCARLERTAREFKRFMEGQGAGGWSGEPPSRTNSPGARVMPQGAEPAGRGELERD